MPSARPSASRASRSDSSPRHERRPRVGGVLLSADDVEAVRRAERALAVGDRGLLERHPEADAVDLRLSLGGDDGDDLVGDAEGERPLRVVHREASRVLAELVDADLIELLDVDEVLLDSWTFPAVWFGMGIRDDDESPAPLNTPMLPTAQGS